MERADRIAGEMKKEISDIIRSGIKDPRLPELVSVTAVQVTKDLRYAKVHISVLGDDSVRQNALEAMKHAAGYIRHELGKRIKLRYTPELKFLEDKSIEQGIYINRLIDETLHREEESRKQ